MNIGHALLPEEEQKLLETANGIDSACYQVCVLALDAAMPHDEIRSQAGCSGESADGKCLN